MAVDVGAVTHGSAGQWLSASMLGAVSEYARRVTAERTQDSKRRAVERGVPPFPNVPPGYRRRTAVDDSGKVTVLGLEPHPDHAPIVAQAFRLRAGGATVMAVREHLRSYGIERSFHGTTSLLASRIVLGELSFGKLVNTDSHPALIDAETWGRVQRMKSPRGRRAKSERLLARLGVLRCGTCGARLTVCNTRTQTFYRCSATSDCPARVAVSADVAEAVVVDAVKDLLAGIEGRATIADGVVDAERDLDAAEQALDAAVEAFTGLDDVAAARARLAALREARDQARERLVELDAAAAPAVTVGVSDWDELTMDEQRALIRAVVADAVVAKGGRGRNRITVNPR